jgi:hypothetical protein
MRLTRLAGLTLAATLGASLPAGAETVAHAVFEPGFLKDLTAPATFRYRFEVSGETIKEPIASNVVMDVREVKADGSKVVHFDMFDGQRQAGPMAAREQNLVVLTFLQRDVAQMANLTGGAAGYFQQQIRRSFNGPAVTDEVEVEVAGQPIRAQRLVIKPFADDPNIARFPRFREKAYEFVVAQEVPGGIYRVATHTPDPENGAMILEESLTFAEVRR